MNVNASTTPFPIRVRRDIAFDFRATPAHHFPGDPMTSHLWNALSILTPYTEAFLIRAMKRARPELTDPILIEQVNAFLAQEGLHTRQHNLLNSRLAELGYDVEHAERAAEDTLRELTDRQSLEGALALVIAGEYLIYALARTVLEEPRVLASTAPEIRRLMQWHAVEEIEHQSVACDVYRHLYGASVRHRTRHMLALFKACHILLAAVRRIETILLQGEPEPTPAQRRAHRSYLFGRSGLAWRVTLKLPRFFAPGFRHWSSPRDRTLITHGLDRVYSSV
jgi:predicted metal-dependent hydrolase